MQRRPPRYDVSGLQPQRMPTVHPPGEPMPTPGSTRSTWSSLRLLRRARAGDSSAVDALFERHWRPLLRWAHGRLPAWARSAADTADLVQDAVLQTFRRLDRFEPRGRRALQAYLREAIHNRIRDELRRAVRQPPVDAASADQVAHSGPSPLQAAIDSQRNERIRAALARLSAEERELVVGRFDLGYSYEQLALVCRRATPDAARIAVRRALVKLAAEMSRA